jgi:8-oxo-dGTP diphosphatase
VADARSYPTRPFLAVSAAIVRAGQVLLVRRARPPADGLFSLPGGVVEIGETLREALIREVREETSLSVEPVALAGFRESIQRDRESRIERHFVILPFAARWLKPQEIAGLSTTQGLAEIVATAFERLQATG